MEELSDPAPSPAVPAQHDDNAEQQENDDAPQTPQQSVQYASNANGDVPTVAPENDEHQVADGGSNHPVGIVNLLPQDDDNSPVHTAAPANPEGDCDAPLPANPEGDCDAPLPANPEGDCDAPLPVDPNALHTTTSHNRYSGLDGSATDNDASMTSPSASPRQQPPPHGAQNNEGKANDSAAQQQASATHLTVNVLAEAPPASAADVGTPHSTGNSSPHVGSQVAAEAHSNNLHAHLGRPPTPSSILSATALATATTGAGIVRKSQQHRSPPKKTTGRHSRPSSGMSVASEISATPTEVQTLATSYRLPARALSPLKLRSTHSSSSANTHESSPLPEVTAKVLVDLRKLLSEPTLLRVADGLVPTEDESHLVRVHPKLEELVSIANIQIQQLPAALAHVLREDSQRSREVMLSLCSFLSTFTMENNAASKQLNEEASTSAVRTSSASPSMHLPRGVQINRPHRSNRRGVAQASDRVMESLFSTPTIVQAIPSVDGSRIDVARVVHDGSRRVVLQQIPLSLELTTIALEEKRQALQQLLHPTTSSVAPSEHTSVSASGSPVKAVLAERQRHNSNAVSSSAVDAVTAFTNLRVAMNDVAMAQEHAAIVQLYVDAAASASAMTVPSSSSHPKGLTDSLDAAEQDLHRQLHDVDTQLRELRNVPSSTAATKAHRVSRQVTVDKEELLGRDRLVIRSGLDTVALCKKERACHQTLLREERRTLQASVQSLRSSTVGRDDEITSKNTQLKQLAAYYREASVENEELRQMLMAMIKHTEDLEKRIEASKRLPPQVSTQRSFLQWAGSGGETPITRQGSLLTGQQLLHSYNSLLNESADPLVAPPGVGVVAGGGNSSSRASSIDRQRGANQGASPTHPDASGGAATAEPTTHRSTSRGGSPSSRPMSPSSAMYHVSPNLSHPRRLSGSQQSDLSSRLHDAPVHIRRSYDAVVKSKMYAKQRALPPPSLCTKPHHMTLGGKTGVTSPIRQHDDDDELGGGDDEEEATAPSIEELNARFYQERKDGRRKLMDRLLAALEAKEQENEAQRPLRLKGRPGFTADDLAANVEHLYRSSVAQHTATRAKLFEDLVLSKERPYSPKKLGRDELDEAIKRLSTTK